jgi:hypothetical protein
MRVDFEWAQWIGIRSAPTQTIELEARLGKRLLEDGFVSSLPRRLK